MNLFTQIVIFKYNWDILNQVLLPFKFYGSDMRGMYFFIFISCEPLTDLNIGLS